MPAGKLDGSVVPSTYRLDLTVDPAKERFSGHVEIDATSRKASRFVWLHGKELKVSRVTATAGGKTLTGTFAQVDPTGVALLTFPEALPAGAVTFAFDYDAPFGEGPAGMFRVKVGDDWYSWTQFESIDARAAFPGFDEPGFKTPWTVTLRTPAGLKAVSNAPETATRTENGMTVHTFAPTLPLPSYLVAMMVGPFATVEGTVPATPQRATPLPIRVVSTKQNADKLAFALEGTKGIVQHLEAYFGQSFPYPKLDQITAPIMPGAMENAGADLYEDSILVMDDKASTSQKRTFGMVVAHELAHQWFGDLVTPAVGRHLAERKLRQLDGLPHRQRMAAGPQHRRGRAGRRLRRDEHRRADRRPPDPPADPEERRYRCRVRYDHLWQGRACGGDDRRLHGRYALPRWRARLHGEAPLWQRHQRGLLRRDGRCGGRSAHPFGDAELHRPAGRAAGDVRGRQERRLDGNAKPLRPAGHPRPRDAMGHSALRAAGDDRQCSLMTGPTMKLTLKGKGPVNAGGTGYYRFELPAAEWDTLIASAASLPGGEAQALEDSIAASFMAGAPRPRK
jgi:hypothetical protein